MGRWQGCGVLGNSLWGGRPSSLCSPHAPCARLCVGLFGFPAYLSFHGPGRLAGGRRRHLRGAWWSLRKRGCEEPSGQSCLIHTGASASLPGESRKQPGRERTGA